MSYYTNSYIKHISPINCKRINWESISQMHLLVKYYCVEIGQAVKAGNKMGVEITFISSLPSLSH